MVYLMKLEEEEQTGSGSVATKKDIDDLEDKLVWPPEFTRDVKLKKMQKLLDRETEVMNDPSLTNTEKVLRVGEIKRQFEVHHNDLPMKIGAVPPVPLKSETKVTETKVEDTESEEEEEEEDSLPQQTELHAAELLKPLQDYRKPKARLMLKKLAAAGSLNWDDRGNVYHNGSIVPGAHMGELVQYFQTARKQKPLTPPMGQVMFSHALRHAGAMEDVALGGVEDDEVRQVFKGITPVRARKPGARYDPYPRVYKPARGTVVTQLEY